MNVLIVLIITIVLNILLGKMRTKYKKFSFAWWLMIHASIPLIIPLRIGLNIPTIYIPFCIGLAVVGQYIGTRLSASARVEQK